MVQGPHKTRFWTKICNLLYILIHNSKYWYNSNGTIRSSQWLSPLQNAYMKWKYQVFTFWGQSNISDPFSTHPSPSFAWWYWRQSCSQENAHQLIYLHIAHKLKNFFNLKSSLTWHHLALAFVLLVQTQMCELPHFVHCIRLDSSETKPAVSWWIWN